MFTGIIEELGEVRSISKSGRITVISVESKICSTDVKIGDSVALNGACLTVVKNKNGILSFEAMDETLNLTNLGKLKISDRVNLERALKLGDRLSGHFVTGHIDCAGIIRKKTYADNNFCFEIAIGAKSIKNLVAKGSVTVDGISLTVVDVKADSFTVYIIPHTIKSTSLQFKEPSDKVNIEFDILGKYVLNSLKT